MKKISTLIFPLMFSLALLVAACAPQSASEPTAAPTEAPVETQASAPSPQPTPEPTATPAPASIAEIAAQDGRFETLVTALQATDLVSALQDGGPYTVFAPTDDAFAALPEGTVDSLLDDPEILSNILLYHVVEGEVMAADVVTMDGQEVETLSGETLTINVDGETVMVNDAQVIITDIEAANGVIHVIDGVLMPPAEEPMSESDMEPAEQTIAEIAAADERFSTLVTALQTAGLVEALQGEGPFTVFAPTNEAFEALPEGTLDELLADPEALSNVLLYHVVEGKVMAADVVNLDGQEVETLLGQTIMISVADDAVMVNDAQVIITDIEAANGVIHVIDRVLLPPQ